MKVQFARARVLLEIGHGSFVEVTLQPHEKWGDEFHYRLLYHEHDTLARWIGKPDYIDPVLLGKAERIVTTIHNVKDNLARLGQGRPQYKALLPLVNATLRRFERDFTFHDALRFALRNPQVFVWGVRTTGTDLFTSAKSEDWAKAVVKNMNNTWYLYDHGELDRIQTSDVVRMVQAL